MKQGALQAARMIIQRPVGDAGLQAKNGAPREGHAVCAGRAQRSSGGCGLRFLEHQLDLFFLVEVDRHLAAVHQAAEE